jgi:hypothetical protein
MLISSGFHFQQGATYVATKSQGVSDNRRRCFWAESEVGGLLLSLAIFRFVSFAVRGAFLGTDSLRMRSGACSSFTEDCLLHGRC